MLNEALTNHIDLIPYENKGKVEITFSIKAFPFKTTVKKFGPIHLVFVNEAFQTIADKSSTDVDGKRGKEIYGKHSLKLVEQFFQDAPPVINAPMLIYIFNAGAASADIPYDPLCDESSPKAHVASYGNLDRDFPIPSRSFFTNKLRDKTYNLSRLGPGSNLEEFTPLKIEKEGANSISGRNALVAINTTQKRLSRASITTKMMNSDAPGGIGIINLKTVGSNSAFLHEIAHAITQYRAINFNSTNVSKLLGNPTQSYTHEEKSEDYKNLYSAWSKTSPKFTYPSFDFGHPRPFKDIGPNAHRLAMSTMILLNQPDPFKSQLFPVPVEISQVQSYGNHPFSYQLLAYAEIILLSQSADAALRYVEANRPPIAYQFYMFAAAVLINADEFKFPHTTHDRDISHFISKIKTYNNNLLIVKNTKSYAFVDLLNKGVDDLHDNFSDDISLVPMTRKFDDFKKARKKEYELRYEDLKENAPGILTFLPLDGDFMKLNNSISNTIDTFEALGGTTLDNNDDLRQPDIRLSSPGTSDTLFSHHHPDVLDVLGFRVYEEAIDSKRVGEVIEVYNGEPVQERVGTVLMSGTIKKHRLIISRAKHFNVAQLELAHRKESPLTAREESIFFRSVYGAELVPKSLAFLKTDGSGEEESKFVYVLVCSSKTNLDVNKATITDDIGVSMDIE